MSGVLFGSREMIGAPEERNRRFPLVAVVLLACLAITLAGIFPFRQMIAQHRQVAQTQAQLDTLLDENRRLEDTVTALESDSEVERLAREQLGMVRPGEIAYAVEPGNDTADVAPAPVEQAPPDDRSLLAHVWDFLTGRDLVPDG